MSQVKVPDEMLKVFWAEYSGGPMGPDSRSRSVDGLAAVIRWLDEILHEANPDFHRAILKRERERFIGSDVDLNVVAYRVAFEYGASFARNYIRNLFLEPETPPEIEDLMWVSHLDDAEVEADHNKDVEEAFRRGKNWGK